MAIYIFEHPETKERVEVSQRMNQEHRYVDEQGTEWQRVWVAPNASIDTQIDPFSEQQFVDKTRGKGMKLGDLWDESARMSKIRQKRTGVDPVKAKYLKDYSKKRKGTKHLDDPSRKIEISGS